MSSFKGGGIPLFVQYSDTADIVTTTTFATTTTTTTECTRWRSGRGT
jgi:hypothetical protein